MTIAPRTELEDRIIRAFIEASFGHEPAPNELSLRDEHLLNAIIGAVDAEFGMRKYVLGLAIDFTLLAQELSRQDPGFTPLTAQEDESVLFQRYPLVTKKGNTQANTLTVSVGASALGIRRFEERVANAFHAMERSKYPSAYVYNTGQWTKYKGLLRLCFSLTQDGRREAIERLFAYGLEKLERNVFFGRDQPRVRVFERALSEYQREDAAENGGLVLQAMVFGFLSADHPHLQWIADKVRTGSSRQRRFGDIDGYHGLELELSAEVKDIMIDEDNLERQLGPFIGAIRSRGVRGMVFARDFSEPALEHLAAAGIIPTDDEMLRYLVSRWDFAKQDIALQATLHYLAHIEQNPSAVSRFLTFAARLDGRYASLTAG